MKIDFIKASLCLACVILFFAGRCTAPKPDFTNYTHKVDSLNKAANISRRLQTYYLDKANKAYKKGVEAQKVKAVTRTIYINDRARNHSISHFEKDSIIKSLFSVEANDNSRFSRPVADSILDMEAKNRMLEANQNFDSITILAFAKTKAHLDSALISCNEESKAKDLILESKDKQVKKANKESRKQKRLKWIAILGLFIVTTLSASK